MYMFDNHYTACTKTHTYTLDWAWRQCSCTAQVTISSWENWMTIISAQESCAHSQPAWVRLCLFSGFFLTSSSHVTVCNQVHHSSHASIPNVLDTTNLFELQLILPSSSFFVYSWTLQVFWAIMRSASVRPSLASSRTKGPTSTTPTIKARAPWIWWRTALRCSSSRTSLSNTGTRLLVTQSYY